MSAHVDGRVGRAELLRSATGLCNLAGEGYLSKVLTEDDAQSIQLGVKMLLGAALKICDGTPGNYSIGDLEITGDRALRAFATVVVDMGTARGSESV